MTFYEIAENWPNTKKKIARRRHEKKEQKKHTYKCPLTSSEIVIVIVIIIEILTFRKYDVSWERGWPEQGDPNMTKWGGRARGSQNL